MSYSFFPYTSSTPMGDGSSVNSLFLTPPLTPHMEHDVPYRPTETDRTSLSMKKRRRTTMNKKKSTSTGVENVQADNSRMSSTSHSSRRKSLSVLHGVVSAESSFGPAHKDEKKLRRWTLPSKSAPTSVFTPLRSTVKQATLTTRPESPAMITLQRATTNKKPTRIELTFFPEPKFGNEKSGLLSYIVSTFSRSKMSRTADQYCASLSTRMRRARSASVGSDGAHPTLTFPAATVCTEAFVEPSLAMPGVFPSNPLPPSRRCSTKYVTGDSCYEIIWDENDNSTTTTQESSRPSLTSDRRPSLAAMKLEAQLAQNLQNTRRSSTQSGRSSSRNSQGSVNMFLEQVITPEKLNSLFPRLIRDTALRNLPRSRGGSYERQNVWNMATVESNYQVMIDDSLRSPTQIVDFFPPIQSRRTSDVDDQGWRKIVSTPQSDSQPSRRASTSLGPPRKRLGSMVGSSSHTRRRSSGIADIKSQRGLSNKKRYSKTGVNAMEEQIDDADITPLLYAELRHQASHD